MPTVTRVRPAGRERSACAARRRAEGDRDARRADVVSGHPFVLASATWRFPANAVFSAAVCGLPPASVNVFGAFDAGHAGFGTLVGRRASRADGESRAGDGQAGADKQPRKASRAVFRAPRITRSPFPGSPMTIRRRRLARVGDDAAVEHLDLARKPRGQVAVVGDDHDRRSACMERFEQRDDRGAGGAVEVAGRLVGEHDRGLTDERARNRDTLALPTRELRRPEPGPMAETDPGERLGRLRAPSRSARTRCRAARRRRSPGPSRARPGRTAGTRTRCAWHATPRARDPSAARHRGRSGARCPSSGDRACP